MARKKRTWYPTKKTKGPPPGPSAEPAPRPSLASINTRAGVGRDDIAAGSAVTILGSGLYAGETAIVERLIGGVIPAALVRTDAGQTRQVRTIDLELVGKTDDQS